MTNERTQYGTQQRSGNVLTIPDRRAFDPKIAKSNVIEAFGEVLVSRQVDKHGNPLTEWKEVK